MPNLMQFRVFIAVAESGGIRSAAERVGRTPSAVSMTLKQLNDELGGPLFEGERKVRLTPFGDFVLDHARSLVEHADRVVRTIGAFSRNGEGSVDVALLPSIAMAFLSDTLRTFTEGRPTAEVHVRDLDSNAILDAVSREIVDWGVASYHHVPQIEAIALFSEPLKIVCASNDPLCDHAGPIPWSAVENRTFIGNGSYESISNPAFHSIVAKQRMHIRSVLSLLSSVRAGVGITVLPGLSKVGDNEGLSFLPIDDPQARRTVYMLSREDRNLSPAARYLAKVLRDMIAARAGDYGLELCESADRA